MTEVEATAVARWRVGRKNRNGWPFGPKPDGMYSWSREEGVLVGGIANTEAIARFIVDAYNRQLEAEGA